jgi:transposase
MISKEQLIILLGLQGIEIEDVELSANNVLIIRVRSVIDGCHCHRCGKPTDHYHGLGQEIKLRHLPIFGYKTYIVMRPKRYQCQACDDKPTTTQRLEWHTPKSSFTKAYEQDVMLSLVNSTIQDVSIKHDIGQDAIEGILDRHVQATVDWDKIKSMEVVGVDEIALKKGHRDFVTIVSAYVQGKLMVLGILADRTKATVKAFFLSIPKRLRRTVRAVCSDLYKGFISAAKEVFGKRVAVCADRFHVAKLYREGLDSLRKKEMRRLKKELSEADYKSLEKVLWLVRKPFDELTSDEQHTLNRLFRFSPKMRQAYELCGSLTSIYNSPLSKGHGKRKMKGWMRRVANSGLTCFDRFLKTLETNMEEITNYFIDRNSSGFVEGLNNRIKVLKRRCYGITNCGRLFQRLCLDLQGYAMFL